MLQSDRKGEARINIATAAAHEIIAAPTRGHIEIDHITMITDGGANQVTFSKGATAFCSIGFDDNQAYVFDNFKQSIEFPEATAFNMTLGSASQTSGFVLYRIVGE